MSHPMRILHFRQRFSKLSETFIYDLLVELDRSSDGHGMLTLSRENSDTRPFPDVMVCARPPRLHPLRIGHRLAETVRRAPRQLRDFRLIRSRLVGFVRRYHPDVIHAHFGAEGSMIAPVARQFSIPLITSFYGYDASRLMDDPTWRNSIAEEVFGGRYVVSVSDRMRDRLIGFGLPPEKARVIRLGKPLREYPYTPSAGIRRFLSIGRMTEKKGHMDAVRAFIRAGDKTAGAHLDVVGGGELLEDVRRLVQLEEAEPLVTLHGALPHAEVRRMLEGADAFLLASKTAASGDEEGMPTVLTEAQACGLPCVSTLHSGIPEGIPTENHRFLAAEGDVAGLASCITRLLHAAGNEEVEAIARAGRAHVEAHYDLAKQTMEWAHLYQECVPS
jgi:colanic acid/amylovoran biosynthesis glycosyltransferase